MKKPFYATKPGPVGKGTVGELIHFLEKLTFFLNPSSGVEYWQPAQKSSFASVMVPTQGLEAKNVHHSACYLRRGNESPIIEIALSLRDQSLYRLAWVKLFGRREECWKLVDTISETLDSIIFEQQVPCILEMFETIPRSHRYSLKSTLAEMVNIESTETSITVSTSSGQVFTDTDLASLGSNAPFMADALKKDWINVLTLTGTPFMVNSKLPTA